LIARLVQEGWPGLILGQGSNLLISDEGWPGLVVKLGRAFDWIEVEGSRVRVGGATPLPRLVKVTADLGLAGLDRLVGIPGSVGGALRLNAGAFGSWLGDWTVELSGRRLTGEASSYKREEIGFGYRGSSLPKDLLIIEATFELWPDEPKMVRKRLAEQMGYRRRTQPRGRSAGCIFRNPVSDSAGAILERCGLKGCSVGDAFVSHRHANFIINRGQATCAQVLELISYMKQKVKSATGLELKEEVSIIKGVG
jgi:UDP-N-acetylmuramate dehydrogenase